MSNQGSELAEQAEAEKNASWKGTKESRANSTVPTPTVNQSFRMPFWQDMLCSS